MRFCIAALFIALSTPIGAQMCVQPFGTPVRQAGLRRQALPSYLQGEALRESSGKSGKVAALLSLALPGAGELYLGAPKRATIFLSVEAVTWLSYFRWRSKGNDLKADFRVYADQHWNETRYRDWQVYNAVHHLFNETEHLPDKVTGDIQQYYEMIGKYDQFVFGWDDVQNIPFSVVNDQVASPLRTDYEGQRNDSNRFLKRASTIVGLSVLNRIGSAIHASLYAKSLESGSRAVRLWVRLQPIPNRGLAAAELGTSF